MDKLQVRVYQEGDELDYVAGFRDRLFTIKIISVVKPPKQGYIIDYKINNGNQKFMTVDTPTYLWNNETNSIELLKFNPNIERIPCQKSH